MFCFNRVGEALHDLSEGDEYEARHLQGPRKVCMPPRVVVHIDLNQDEYQEIAKKLDMWEGMEAHRSHTLGMRGAVHTDGPALDPHPRLQASVL